MADIDIDPFGEHGKTESRTDETGENIPLSPVIPGGRSTWEPECELGPTRMQKEIFKNMTYDVTMTSLLKTMGKFGPLRNQTNYISFER